MTARAAARDARRARPGTALRMLPLALALIFGAGAGIARGDAAHAPPHNLHVAAHTVVTTNGLDHTLRMPRRFRIARPEHRKDSFHGHPFQISLTAFLARDAALMVHAETVADGSGASNYDDLPQATLHGLSFHVRPDQCVDLRPAQLRGEHDLLWLRSHGFTPTGPIQIRQYLASSRDHNREIVLSFLLRVPDCLNRTRNRKHLRALIDQLDIAPPPAGPRHRH